MSGALLALTLLAAAPAPAPEATPALERLAAQVAHDVAALRPEPPLALHVEGATGELARAFTTLLAARLGAAGLPALPLEAASPAHAEAQARATGARTLVRLGVAVDAGRLSARGDVLGTWVNFFSGRTPSRPPAPAGALARGVEADAAALALAAAPASPGRASGPGLVRLVGASLARLGAPTAALTAGDLDGDGRDEVAVLTDEEVLVLDARGQVLARHSSGGLPHATTPCREPFGTLAVLGAPARLAAFSARRAQGEELVLERAGGALRRHALLEAPRPAPDVQTDFNGGQASLRPALRLGDAALEAPAPVVSASVVPREGGSAALLVHPDGSASLHPGAPAPPRRLEGLGAASALVDLDGDGALELVTTSPELEPSPERLRVLRWPASPTEPLEAAWQGPLPRGRAMQLTGAELDGDGRREVVVALWLPDGTSELFLLRQVTP